MQLTLLLTSLLTLLTLGLSAPLSNTTSSTSAPQATTSSTPYRVANSYTSSNFFSAFTFFSDADPTGGHVLYQNRTSASKLSLAGRLPHIVERPIFLGMDHSSQAPDGRASVRVQSKDSWMHGLFIFDIAHMPTGCGTWPAAWLVGTGAQWPADGEIDILEGVNDQIGNRMTLHTSAGCSIKNSTQFNGELITPNCDVNAANQDKNAGCQISAASDTASFGTAFNGAGGGIYAVEWTSNGVKIWFFGRKGSNTPKDLVQALSLNQASQNNSSSTSALDPDSWPIPAAQFSGNGCDFDQHIKNQSIVINTSLCGDWAGNQGVWDSSPTCSKKAATCVDFVSKNPQAFRDAFWAINSVTVLQR